MPNNKNVRRSTRHHVPTTRAQQYNKDRHGNRPLFPSVGDDIVVKWVFGNRSIWWPANVVSVESKLSCDKQRVAEILYDKLDDYPPVQVRVHFSAPASHERLVTSSGSSEASSWLFSDEVATSDDGSTESDSDGDTSPISNSTQRRRSGKRAPPSPSILERAEKRLSSGKGSSNVDHHGSSTHPDANGSNSLERSAIREEKNISDSDRDSRRYADNNDLALRLQLVERVLQGNSLAGNSPLSTSANSVVISLRWALLRSLEKPLKRMSLPDLSRHGFASHELSISCHCDYYTFREISAVLAKEHPFASNNPTNSRVAFSPAFHTTQSGSSASNDMNILFTNLADLTAFLRIRDDNDFEGILSKEVLSANSTLLRVLGTCTIDDGQPQKTPGGTSRSTESVSASSEESVPVIRLFVGTSPLQYEAATSNNANSPAVLTREVFHSCIFLQDCKHFCSTLKCYRSPWRSADVQSKHLVNSGFHLDGTIHNGELKNYFVLNWSRQQAPSTTKWTRDVHEAGNNSPGCLRLTVPTVLFSSSRNVTALVSKLDKHIETFMRIRSTLHSLSSFK